MNRAGTARVTHPPSISFPQYRACLVPQPCKLDGISMNIQEEISMNIQEENSACYFRVHSECEQTLVMSETPSIADFSCSS